jgi:glycosyltransferase involved in cell wall biosynthesis
MARPRGSDRPLLLAVVAAQDEEDRIGDTVAALLSIPGVGRVVVADDGSNDRTAERAARAGASVVRGKAVGKGGAVERALDEDSEADVYLLADGDLGESARRMAPLADAVASGTVDLAIGILPPPPTGGFGLVKSLAARLVERVAGGHPTEPLSGQRVVTRECLWACRPLAPGFGMDSAMSADALRLGFRVEEIPVDVVHRFTRKDAAGFLHRARQGLDIVRAMAPRLIGVR